jgi:RHS repeat-associated protein
MVQEQRNNIKKTYIYEPESFKPVAQITDGKTYHYHLDHLGTPRELTDDQGKVVWKVRYKTYGNVAVKEVEEVENNLRFQGQYFDEETGLHYNRFRYYNPNTGQFITQDPIGLLGGVNNYQYAPNPIQWIDPLGLKCKEGYAIVRQFENGRQEGHFTIEVVQGDLSYATHQTILSSDWEETTIVRAGRYNSSATAVHEAIIPLPNAEAALEYQRNMINSPLGAYQAYDNSCLSHVVDVLSAGDGPVYGKSRMGYGKFYRKHGFGRLDADKSILDGG